MQSGHFRRADLMPFVGSANEAAFAIYPSGRHSTPNFLVLVAFWPISEGLLLTFQRGPESREGFLEI